MVIIEHRYPYMETADYLLFFGGLAVILLLAFLCRNFDEKKNRILLTSLGVIYFAGELSRQIQLALVLGYTSYPLFLIPWQFCLISGFLMLPAGLLRNGRLRRSIYDFSASFGIVGALFYLLGGLWCVQTTKALTVHEFLWHMSLLFIAFYLAFSGRLSMSIKGLLRACLLVIGICAVGVLLNYLLYDASGGEIDLVFLGFGDSSQPIIAGFAELYGRLSADIMYLIVYTAISLIAYLILSLPCNRIQKQKRRFPPAPGFPIGESDKAGMPWLKYYRAQIPEFDYPKSTIYECLIESNEDHKGDTALHYLGRNISFGRLFAEIDRCADTLKAMGAGRGDVVTLSLPNIPEAVVSMYACNKIGATICSLDPRISAEQFLLSIRETDSRIVIALGSIAGSITCALAAADMPATVVIPISPLGARPWYRKTVITDGRKACGAKKAECMEKAEYEEDSIALLVKTGGTTGDSKLVALTNENLNAAYMQYASIDFDIKRGMKTLNIMPPFITFGLVIGVHMTLCAGMTSVLIPRHDFKDIPRLLLKYRPTLMTGVPAQYAALISSKRIDKDEDMSFLDIPVVGGDYLNPAAESAINEFLSAHKSGRSVLKGWALTETASAALVTQINADVHGSIGIPLPGTVVSVFDIGTGRELPPGQRGELRIAGPTVMKEYWHSTNETEHVFVKDAAGTSWFCSGDIGYMDKDGHFYFEGRIKRMIVRFDGFKVFPSQIEGIILKHPLVKDVAVTSVPDKEHGSGRLPAAHIVLEGALLPEGKGRQGGEIIGEIARLCRDGLPEYSVPVSYDICTALPLTGLGKVDYERLEQGHNGV
jgi:long-chain acyl-CoA synthetase